MEGDLTVVNRALQQLFFFLANQQLAKSILNLLGAFVAWRATHICYEGDCLADWPVRTARI